MPSSIKIYLLTKEIIRQAKSVLADNRQWPNGWLESTASVAVSSMSEEV